MKTVMKIKSLMLVLLLIFTSFSVIAVQINFDQQHNVSEIYEDDYIFFGEKTLHFTGKVDDLVFGGQTLEFNGETQSSLHAFGQDIVIEGLVGNNLITAGEDISIKGTINDTVMAAGTDIVFHSESLINGDVFTAGKSIALRGIINGDVYAGCAKLTIDGIVHGNVSTGTGKRIIFGENAEIKGNLIYDSNYSIKEDDKNKVNGRIEKKDLKKHFGNFDDEEVFKNKNVFKYVFKLIFLVCILLGGLLLLLFPAMKTLEEPRKNKHFWMTMLWGLIPFFLYPVAILVFFILAPIGLAFLLAAFPLLLVVQIIGAVLVGQFISENAKWNISNRFVFYLLGFALLMLLSFFPVLKILSFIFFSSLGWGVILEKLFSHSFAD
ncbi:MAG: polymer-forming cytoskeletal protein [Spirochaetes bacterium]|nr:polymer-forming cytoskeletal protein [Spirochaetota bacterium]